MVRPRILVLDADQGERSRLRDALAGRGYDAADASIEDGLALLPTMLPDAVVAAPRPGHADVRTIRSLEPDAALVVTVPAGQAGAAVEWLRQGAESWLFAPADGAQAALVVEKALEKRGLRREAARLRAAVRQRDVVVGTTAGIQGAREVVRRAAPTKASLLVQGENGTGRRLLAQSIHEASTRRDGPFVQIHCAGLSARLLDGELFGGPGAALPAPGWRASGGVAAAAGGTLFLHEVAGLPAAAQVKLLRLLQHGEYEPGGGGGTVSVDVRVVASTERDLAEEVRLGRFRDDLYYRLVVVNVSLPPLRERKADIPSLVEHFLLRSSRERGRPARGISPGALSALYAYDWPGNVRELADAVEGAVAQSGGRTIAASHLPAVLQAGGAEDHPGSTLIPGATLAEIEREAILRTLEGAGGSTARAAVLLGISVRKIQYKLREYRGGAAPGPEAAGGEAVPSPR